MTTDKPQINPNFRWTANAAGQMTREAQQVLRGIIDTLFSRTGEATSNLVTGTAGTTNNLAKWNADGDLVDGGSSDIITRWTAASASGPASLDFREDSDNGTSRVRLAAPSSLAADRTVTFPDATGTVLLSSDLGSNVAAWLADPTSAKLAAALTDETGSGLAVFALSGTWTPTVQFGAASVGITYGTRSGSYVQIGPVMFATCDVVLTSKGSSTGAFRITGLPTAPAKGSAVAADLGSGLYAGLTAGFAMVAGAGSTNVSARPFTTTGMGSTAAITDATFTNTSTLKFTLIYGV